MGFRAGIFLPKANFTKVKSKKELTVIWKLFCAAYHSPVINENFTANFGGIFVITLPERSHLFSSVCRIRW